MLRNKWNNQSFTVLKNEKPHAVMHWTFFFWGKTKKLFFCFFLQGLLLDFKLSFLTVHICSQTSWSYVLDKCHFPSDWTAQTSFNVMHTWSLLTWCSPTPVKPQINAPFFSGISFPITTNYQDKSSRQKDFFMFRTVQVWKVTTSSAQVHGGQRKISSQFRSVDTTYKKKSSSIVPPT